MEACSLFTHPIQRFLNPLSIRKNVALVGQLTMGLRSDDSARIMKSNGKSITVMMGIVQVT